MRTLRTPRLLAATNGVGRIPQVRVDEDTAREVAAAYLDAPQLLGAEVRAAYAALARETDQLYAAWCTAGSPAGVRVEFTRCTAPYDDADELITSIRTDRLLEVVTASTDGGRSHPLFDTSMGGAFDRFRAVHDVLGHGHLGVGFDRHCEYAAWRYQERFHSGPARRALATELHAKHSALWTTGNVAENRAVLLDRALVDRARRCGVPQSAEDRTHDTDSPIVAKGAAR